MGKLFYTETYIANNSGLAIPRVDNLLGKIPLKIKPLIITEKTRKYEIFINGFSCVDVYIRELGKKAILRVETLHPSLEEVLSAFPPLENGELIFAANKENKKIIIDFKGRSFRIIEGDDLLYNGVIEERLDGDFYFIYFVKSYEEKEIIDNMSKDGYFNTITEKQLCFIIRNERLTSKVSFDLGQAITNEYDFFGNESELKECEPSEQVPPMGGSALPEKKPEEQSQEVETLNVPEGKVEDTQTQMWSQTEGKLEALRKLHDDSINRNQVGLPYTSACNQAGIDTKTVGKHKPDWVKYWNDPKKLE